MHLYWPDTVFLQTIRTHSQRLKIIDVDEWRNSSAALSRSRVCLIGCLVTEWTLSLKNIFSWWNITELRSRGEILILTCIVNSLVSSMDGYTEMFIKAAFQLFLSFAAKKYRVNGNRSLSYSMQFYTNIKSNKEYTVFKYGCCTWFTHIHTIHITVSSYTRPYPNDVWWMMGRNGLQWIVGHL